MVSRTEVLPNTSLANLNSRRAAAKERKLRSLANREKTRPKKPENETTAYKLFNRSFKVLVAAIHLYDDEYIQTCGIRGDVIYGDKRDIASTSRRRVTKHLSVAELVYLVIENDARDIEFVQPKDAAAAYDIAVDHLEAFVEFLNKPNINTPNVPWEDLFNIDSFCSWVYPKARNYFGTCDHEGVPTSTDLLSLKLTGNFEGDLSQAQRDKGYKRGVAEAHIPVMDEIHPSRIPEEVKINALY